MSATLSNADDVPVAEPPDVHSSNDRVLLIAPVGPRRDDLAEALESQGFFVKVVDLVEVAPELVRNWHPRVVALDVAELVGASLEFWTDFCAITEAPIVLLPSFRSRPEAPSGDEARISEDLALARELHSLAQRVAAIESRAAPEPPKQETLEIGPLRIEQAKRSVLVRGKKTYFSKLEYDLLLALVSPAGQVRTRDELLDGVWGNQRPDDSGTLSTHIKRLRQKLELDLHDPQLIITVRGVGFFFDSGGA